MEIKVLGCSGGRVPEHELTSFLIDDILLLDAGAATALSLAQQEIITDVLITHSHLDHILGLAFLCDNTRLSRVRPLEIYATEPTLRVIREDLFAAGIMPGLLPRRSEPPLINFHAIALEIPFQVGRYEVEAFPVFHLAGAVAFRISDGEHTVVFTGDTGRTDRLWQWVKSRGGIDCLIAEVSFPQQQEELAELTRHLTPLTLIESLFKAGLSAEFPVYVVHLKPPYAEEIAAELQEQTSFRLLPLRRGEIIRLTKGEGGSRLLPEAVEAKVKDKIPSFDATDDLYHQRDRLRKEFGVRVPPGEVIFRQGDQSRLMYIIQEGRVRIFRETEGMEKTLALLGPGDFFGEMAMLNNRPRSATAVALSELFLLAFDRPAFENLVCQNFGIALHIIRTLAHRLYQTDAIIENLLYLDPHSKVINTLLQAAVDEGIETPDGYLVRTSPEKIADRAGVILPTLRSIFAELVSKKVILVRRQAVIIPDLAKLKRLLTFLELRDEFS